MQHITSKQAREFLRRNPGATFIDWRTGGRSPNARRAPGYAGLIHACNALHRCESLLREQC
jgi:hypothetical protein